MFCGNAQEFALICTKAAAELRSKAVAQTYPGEGGAVLDSQAYGSSSSTLSVFLNKRFAEAAGVFLTLRVHFCKI